LAKSELTSDFPGLCIVHLIQFDCGALSSLCSAVPFHFLSYLVYFPLMKPIPILSFLATGLILFMANCTSPQKDEQEQVDEAAMDSVINEVKEEEGDAPNIDQRCFRAETDQHAVKGELQFMAVGKIASGKLNFFPETGDTMIGTFSGTKSTDVIRGRYTYQIGETTHLARVAIALEDGAATLFMVDPDEEEQLNSSNLSNLEPYESLVEVDCP
jgi:hypothetical protein